MVCDTHTSALCSVCGDEVRAVGRGVYVMLIFVVWAPCGLYAPRITVCVFNVCVGVMYVVWRSVYVQWKCS